MSNAQNLIPFDARTESEAREMGRKGGIASGKARRRKKSLKEAADYYLSLPVTDRRRAAKLERRGIDPGDVDNQMAMIAGLWEAACLGDAKAATVLVKLLGEDSPAPDPPVASNLLDVLAATTMEDLETDEIPEAK